MGTVTTFRGSSDVQPPHAGTRVLSASEAARDLVRSLIENGELRPGVRINADELGQRLGVSRTPVRDALHQLRTEGLVDIQPRRGVFVRDISPQEVDEVYELKSAVEPIAAAWATERGSDEAKAQLTQRAELLQAAGVAGEVRRAAGLVDEIHDLLFEMADSDVLRDVYSVFHGRVKWLRHLNMSQDGRLSASVEHHAAIVNLVNAGDAAKAREAMADHMRDARSSVRNVVG